MKMRILNKEDYQELLRKNMVKIYNTDTNLERIELYLLITLGTSYQGRWVIQYMDALKNEILSTRKQ
ncbi:UNVERIFIED_ORG: hypothetical protein [Escherichia phage CMSTMSU]|uniref:Uncharacterized protein n=1 Tax=Escherichia phage fEgEco12 TaxID=3158837 RepID=A0AAU7PG58_9CAUD|nr:hypothetical protein [Escherichia coli]MED6971150.1 hypothetical protein [Escherichia coli O157]QAY00728.1 hypothetical protein Ecwhy1_453 [Escherichia phage Ecwhy_1]EGE5776596.1 hypothetical protein [Escherichia coli]VVY12603.1 Uncharacterised protein [Escherichia coli]HCJ9509986.1 hypothetical protein [Escherichia coli]